MIKINLSFFIEKISTTSKSMHKRHGSWYLTFMSIFICIVIGVVGALLILSAEADVPESRIKDFGNALYWVYCTLSTVGYGDYVPISASGKILANVLMALGIGLYGFAISVITSNVTANLTEKDTANSELKAQNERIEAKLQEVMNKLEEFERNKK